MESILVYQQIFNLCLIRSSNNYWAWNFLNNINRMVSYRTACSNLCIFLANRQLKIRFNKPIRGCFQPGCLIRKSGNRFTIMDLFQEWEISRFRHFLKLYASNSWNDNFRLYLALPPGHCIYCKIIYHSFLTITTNNSDNCKTIYFTFICSMK